MINQERQTPKKWRYTAGRRLLAVLSAVMLLISSGGLGAFAEEPEIISDPVTAPVHPEAAVTPAPAEPDAEPVEEPQPGTEQEPDAEPDGEPDAEPGIEPDAEPELEDLTVYEAGSLYAETDDCSILIEYPAEAKIPEGSTLTFGRVKGAELYSAMKSADKTLKNEQDDTWKRGLADEGSAFYALTITNPDGEEILPSAQVILTYQEKQNPQDPVYFLTGDNARILDAKNGIIRITDYRLEPFGYGKVVRTQTGIITLTFSDRDVMVTASYGPEAGLPADTELVVREIMPGTPEYERCSGLTDEALNEEWSEITLERYFDIAFVCNGEELEPQADVDVQITFRDVIELTDDHDVQAVHIENDEATVIESDTESNKAAKNDDEAIDTVTFSSDSFSVYGVVQRTKITKKVLAADGLTYEINVTYGPEAEIPEGAEVRVEEIPEGSELWEAYRKQTAAALNADDVKLPGLYDISIVFEGEKIEPKAPVSVSIKLENAEDTEDELHVVHFTEEIPEELVTAQAEPSVPDETGEPAETPAPLTEDEMIASEKITAEVEGNTVTFETDSFSVYAFAYTVDFYFGEFEYHLAGRGEMLLSELFVMLGIDRNAADVISAEFTDPTLLQIEQVEGDWKLTSLLPFQTTESLTLKFSNGDTIVIRVEDEMYLFKALVNDNNAGYLSSKYLNRSSNDSYYLYASNVVTNGSNEVLSFEVAAGKVNNNDSLRYGIVANTKNSYQFVYWLKINPDGSKVTITNQTLSSSLSGSTTFIAFYVPNGQKLIRYEAEEHGSIDDANHYATDLNNQNHYFSYSNEEMYAHAKGDWGYVLEGWYQGDTFLSSDPYLNLTDITSDTVITARFRRGQATTVHYKTTWYWTHLRFHDDPNPGNWIYAQNLDPAIAEETIYEGYQDGAQGARAASHGRYGTSEYSYFIGWIDTEGRKISDDAYFIPKGDQIRDTTYTAVFSSKSDYVVIDSDYHCGKVGGSDAYYNTTQLDLAGANQENGIVLAQYNNNGKLLGDLWPIPASESYQFDHWEFYRLDDSGNRTYVGRIDDSRITSGNSGIISGRGVLKAVYKPMITYDVGVINRVGINPPDNQVWHDTISVNGARATSDDNIFTENVNPGSNLSLANKLSQNSRVTQTKNGYNLLSHYLKGWTADRKVTLSNGTTINKGELIPADATIANITDTLRLTAVWSSTFPGKKEYNGGSETGARYNTNSVGFFVRIVDNVADVGNTSLYTDCLYTSLLELSGNGEFATNNTVTGSRHDFFGNGRVTDFGVIETIDSDLRANRSALSYSGTGYGNTQVYDNRYSGAKIKIVSFPSDSEIFAQIRAWNATRHVITVSGQVVPQYMLTSDYFEIKWYVLKDQENQWHVDGMLIPKYAKLRIIKKFIGPDAAIEAGKSGFGITVTETSPKGGKPADTHTLTLAGATADSTGTEFTWVLDHLIPLTAYTVTESGYEATGTGYSASTSYNISNTQQTTGLSGNTPTASVESVYVYPDYVTQDSYQTVAYRNQYTEPYIMTIMKQDGDTKNPLPGSAFDVTIRNEAGEILSTSLLVSDTEGKMAVDFRSLGEGTYYFELDERPREGYQPLDPEGTGKTHVTGKAIITAEGLVTLENVEATYTGDNVVPYVDVNNSSVVYVENKPERTNITVRKQWKNVNGENQSTGKPVTIQLLRNGASLTGKTVVLGSSEESEDGLTRVPGWEYTWSDLPAYVDGEEAIYTVREEWIGEPGASSSVHYNTANDTDGYAGYIVSQTQTQRESGTQTIIDIRIENTPDEGQIIISKVDTKEKVVAGAVFEVFEDLGFGHGPDENAPKAGEYPSDPDGILRITGLNPSKHWYWMRERFAPEGYVKSGTWYLLDVQEHNSAVHPYNPSSNTADTSTNILSIINEPVTANIKVIKTGRNNQRLPGATFSLHRVVNNLTSAAPVSGYEWMTTDGNGEIDVSNLGIGTYALVEEEAPDGYQPLEHEIIITVATDGTVTVSDSTVNYSVIPVITGGQTVYSVTIPNEPDSQTVKLIKRAIVSESPIAGAEFQIFTENPDTNPAAEPIVISDELILEWNINTLETSYKPDRQTLISGSNGCFYSGSLPIGTYYIKETQAPDNYLADSKVYAIRITGSGMDVLQNGVWVARPQSSGEDYYELYIDNIPTTSITVVKEWSDQATNPHTGESVELVLIRYRKNDAPVPPGPGPNPESVVHAIYQYTGVTETAVMSTLPSDSTAYATAAEITAISPSQTTVETGEGVWTFNGWTRTEGENVTFTGTWTFTPNPEPAAVHAIYQYTGVTEAAVMSTLPSDSTAYATAAEITALSPSQTTVETGEGVWTFNGWTRTEGENVTFTGTWTFTPNPEPVVHAIYQYTGVTEAAVLSTLPSDSTAYATAAEITALSPSQTTVETGEGVWTFNGWTRTEGENVTFTGTWTFTPNPEPVSNVSSTWRIIGYYNPGTTYDNGSISYPANAKVDVTLLLPNGYWPDRTVVVQYNNSTISTTRTSVWIDSVYYNRHTFSINMVDNAELLISVHLVQSDANPVISFRESSSKNNGITIKGNTTKHGVRFRADAGAGSVDYASDNAPTGYHKDEETPIILNSTNGWSEVISNLPIYDENGEPYYYFIEERDVPPNYTVSYSPDSPAIATDASITLTAVNTRITGNLSVTKHIEGNGSITSFHFIVKLGDTSVSGSYGGMSFTAGVAEFNLTDGETITATGLPSGITYTVVEEGANENHYVTEMEGDTGTIPENRTAAAVFTNTYSYNPTGSVPFTAKKTLNGETLASGQFTFTLTETDENWEPLDGGVVQTITNDGSGEVLFEDVELTPSDTVRYFVIAETNTGDPTIEYDAHEQRITVTVTDDGNETLVPEKTYETDVGLAGYDAAFDNTKKGNLTVTKSVGNIDPAIAADKEFTFEVVLTDAENKAFTGTVTVQDNTRNAQEVTLEAQDEGKILLTVLGTGSAYITNIPAGTQYQVDEPSESMPAGWIPVPLNDGKLAAISGGNADQTIDAGETETATVRNKELTEVQGTKTWINAGTQRDNSNDLTLSLTRKPDVPNGSVETVDVQPVWDGDNYSFTELDKYDPDGNLYVYDVDEVQFRYDGHTYTVTKSGEQYIISEGGTAVTSWVYSKDGFDFTNERLVTVTLKKTDGTQAITGAKFTLAVKTNNTFNGNTSYTVDSPEGISIPDLKAGAIYRLEETSAPAGYVITQQYTYFKVIDDQIILTDENGNELTGDALSASAASVDGANGLLLSIMNPHSSVMPSTGGSGTLPYTLGGTVLILLAVILFISRKRKAQS